MTGVFTGFLLIYVPAAIWFAHCNDMTFKQRNRIINRVSELTRADISLGTDSVGSFLWRYECLETVTYWRHLWQLFFLLDHKRLYPHWATNRLPRLELVA